MSKITTAIPEQKFQFITRRVFEILMDEFNQQQILTYDNELDVDFFLERTMPFDKEELPTINISFVDGDYSNKHQGSQDGLYQIFIDAYASAKTTATQAGDTLANLKVQKMLGVTRAILEDPVYKTLGVVPPFIMKSYVSKITIAAPNKNSNMDGVNNSMGRLIFNVVANETSKLIIPQLIAEYQTQIKIDNSGKGYFYLGINYPN